MAQVKLSDYKNLYLQTAKENIDNISSSCLKLMENPSEKKEINAIHINSHSLRTKSQVMGFIDIAALAETIEKISDGALKGNVQMNNQIISEIKKSVEKLDEILKLIQDDTVIKA